MAATWKTIREKTGRYTRMSVEINDGAGSYMVFQIRYADAKAFKRYYPDYLKFKKSLVQYAD